MATKFKDTFLTNEFVTSVTDAIATGKSITLTQAIGSSTVYTDDQLKNINYSQSQSANKEVVSVINSPYRKQDNNTIVIEINMSNEQVSADFQLSTILIYGKYNGNNILVGVARLNTPELFPAYDGKSIITTATDIFVAIDKVGTVNIAVSAAGLATADSVQQLRQYVDNDFDATIARLNRDNNFLNSNSFAKAINALAGINGALNTRIATFTDFADVAKNMVQYAGFWVNQTNIIANSPNNDVWTLIQVQPSQGSGNGFIKIIKYQNISEAYYTSVTGGKIVGWRKVANDDTVLHNASDETADGIKTFIKQIIAQAGVKGNLFGNADTATKFKATHKIGGVPFDGGSDINLAGVNIKGTQDTSGKAATAGVADSAAKADKLSTGAKINGTNFDGTTDIQVPASNDGQLVHKTGNETVGGQKTFNDAVTFLNTIKGFLNGNISGYAEKLRVARAIAGVAFDGTKDIDLPGVNKTGNQDTTGSAASATTINVQNIANSTDLNTIVTTGVYHADNTTGLVNSPTTRYFILVVNTGVASNGVQTLYDVNSNRIFTRIWRTTSVTFSDWILLADDSAVLHNTGNENADGIKTFIKQIVASAGVKGNLTGNADTATRLATARKIGGVSFNGTADIVLAGVNAKGNQDTSGNADTATTLEYQVLTDGVDLNTIKTAGLYGIGAASSVKNTPVSRYFLMEVTTIGTTNVKQVVYDTNNNNVWVRSMYGSSTFTSWEMLGLDDTLLHNSGNEVASGNKQFKGQLIAEVDATANGGFFMNMAADSNAARQIIWSRADIGNDNNGAAIVLGAGGLSILGGGEAGQALLAAIANGQTPASLNLNGIAQKGNNETAIVISDGRAVIGTSYQSGGTTGQFWIFNTDGTVATPNGSTLAEDANVVHRTGNEEVVGVKKFQSYIDARGGVQGDLTGNVNGFVNITKSPVADLNSLVQTGKFLIDNTMNNIPYAMPNGAFIDVMNYDGNLVYQTITARDVAYSNSNVTVWVRMRIGSNWGNWESLTKDRVVIGRPNYMSGFTDYVDTQQVQLKRSGNWVEMVGAFTNSKLIPKNSATITMKIPYGFVPSSDHQQRLQGSYLNTYLANINADATVSIGRYGTTSDIDIPAGTWLVIGGIGWYTNDPFPTV